MVKKFGQFRRNMTKSGQMLEKDSQPKDSNIFLNKIFFLKPELFAIDLWSSIFDLGLQFFYKSDFKTWILWDFSDIAD
jgi:hypothetical protein